MPFLFVFFLVLVSCACHSRWNTGPSSLLPGPVSRLPTYLTRSVDNTLLMKVFDLVPNLAILAYEDRMTYSQKPALAAAVKISPSHHRSLSIQLPALIKCYWLLDSRAFQR